MAESNKKAFKIKGTLMYSDIPDPEPEPDPEPSPHPGPEPGPEPSPYPDPEVDPGDSSLEQQGILNSIKKKLGTGPDYTYFDHDVITEINMNFATLFQVGVGIRTFVVKNEADKWVDYYNYVKIKNRHTLELIKEYTYIGVRLIFDPPESSFMIDALNKKKEELEWRIYLDEDLLA